jgi:hypothetical protein
MGKHQPALLGGVFIGVLSALPYINAANCCCLWVIGGGVLVVYLQQQASPTPVATGDAVIGGLIAGAIGGVIVTLANALMMQATGPMILEQMRSQGEQMPPEVMAWMERIFSGSGIGLMMIMMAVCIPIFAIFSMLGSFLGLAIFRKKIPPQPQV